MTTDASNSVVQLRESHGRNQLLQADKRHLAKQSETYAKEASQLRESLAAAKCELGESGVEIKRLTELNVAFQSNVKVQKTISGKIAKDLELEEASAKHAERQINVLSRKLKKVSGR